MSTFVLLVATEVVLRFVFPRGYYVWPPHLHQVFHPRSGIMPGIEGEKRFITNSKGMRADESANDNAYRILAVGASTTECVYLDQAEAWPQLLQENLNRNQSERKVWIGNVGKGGLITRDHVIQVRYLIAEYRGIDAMILLIGGGDLTIRLAQDSKYDPDFLSRKDAEQQILARVFWNPIDESEPGYKRTAIWQLLRRAKAGLARPPAWAVEDEYGTYYIAWRQHRHSATTIRDTLPDLTSALDEYARNINAIVDLARERSIRLIFATQPSMWKPNLPRTLDDLLWQGGVGNFQERSGKEYYSVEALSRGMELYNETLIKICHARKVEFIDLAQLLPKDTSVFYDDVHLNESGARKVAELLGTYLLRERFGRS